MIRTTKIFNIENPLDFYNRSILWSDQFREVVSLDSNDHKLPYHSIEKVIACDAMTSIETNDIVQLKEYQSHLRDWCFGFISYDIKNDLFDVTSFNEDHIGFKEMCFFQPKRLIVFNGNLVEFSYLACCDDEIDDDFNQIMNTSLELKYKEQSIDLVERVPFERYKQQFDKALQYIKRGDTYELNYCVEFFHQGIHINPYSFYNVLNSQAKSSFASFVKWNNCFAMCASPERFIKKIDQKIVSQPIKGTAKRGISDFEDQLLIKELQASAKERSENIMIVDLVRNDLSKIALKNTVKVEELCGVYTFSHVHQMISTVTCEVDFTTSPLDIIFETFPMASMTGVPKKRTLEIIEELEDHKRGLYSGTIGYISPQNDFDFNVVIRALLYNADTTYLSLSVGSAVTYLANAEDEYKECLLKASAIRQLLEKHD